MKLLSQKCAQLTTYFAGAESTYVVNMRTILGETNFKIGDKYNIYLRAQMNDVGAVPAHHRADRFLLSSSMMRFNNYETPVGKQSSKAEIVSYGSFPLFFDTNATLIIWLYVHQNHFGWAFLSPNYTEHNNIKGASQFIQSIFLIIWRLVDNGMLTVYVLLAYFAFKQKLNKELLIYSLIILVVNSICMAVFLYNTIGHRYFMISQFMLIILLLHACNQKNVKWVIGMVFTSLLFGNFMYYPGKVIADTNLQYRNFFKLEQQVKTDFDSVSFYSYAPISSSAAIRYLNGEKGLKISSLNDLNLDTIPALLQSNVNAEFTKPQRDYLTNNWYGNSYENGAVYVNVFLNPKFYHKPTWFKLRESNYFETKLQELKYKIRGE